MENKKDITNLLEEFSNNSEGRGPILWHKKPHKNGSGSLACVLGIVNKCLNPVNCADCYADKIGGNCLKYGGESVGGFLAVEYKHQKLVDAKKFGAYSSIREAIKNLS